MSSGREEDEEEILESCGEAPQQGGGMIFVRSFILTLLSQWRTRLEVGRCRGMSGRVGGSMMAVFECGSASEGQLLGWSISNLFAFVSRSSCV